jgi:hypothetical protein
MALGKHTNRYAACPPSAMQPRARRSPTHVIGQTLLLLLALCVFSDSVRAFVCEIQDRSPPVTSQVSTDAFVNAPSAIDDDGCAFCYGCSRCGGCCSQSVAPVHATVLMMSAAEIVVLDHPTLRLDTRRLPADLFRPPIAA